MTGPIDNFFDLIGDVFRDHVESGGVRRAVLAAVCGGYAFFALYLFALTGAATFRSGKGLVLIAGVWIVVIYGGYRLWLFASEHWASS